MAIISLASFKEYVRDEANGVNDAVLSGYIDAASSALSGVCAREWVVAGGAATARSFNPRDAGRLLDIDDCTTITSVVENGVTLVAGTDYEALPIGNRSLSGETVPYCQLAKAWWNWYTSTGLASVTVTATWGWVAIPYQIIEACKVLGKELCNNQDVRLGIVAISDAAISGIRQNKVVRDAVDLYRHPRSISI